MKSQILRKAKSVLPSWLTRRLPPGGIPFPSPVHPLTLPSMESPLYVISGGPPQDASTASPGSVRRDAGSPWSPQVGAPGGAPDTGTDRFSTLGAGPG